MTAKLTSEHLSRRAVVYVRQSTPGQVQENRERQRRQYGLSTGLANLASLSSMSSTTTSVGRSGSGLKARPGFDRLVAEVCAGNVGAVLCIEASRLARNGRDWHCLVDFCGLVGAVNPVLAEAAKNFGFVNRFGRGVPRTLAAMAKNGSPAPEFSSTDRHFLVVLRRAP